MTPDVIAGAAVAAFAAGLLVGLVARVVGGR